MGEVLPDPANISTAIFLIIIVNLVLESGALQND